LALWERGLVRHPIDRALLLCAWARPELSPSQLPDLPLGSLNRTLLRLREACFGPQIRACVDCEQCSECLELTFNTGQLLAGANGDDTSTEFVISSLRFRIPCSRDLAAISGEGDIKAAALKILEQCCLEHPGETNVSFASLLAEAEEAMDRLDPAADISLTLHCEKCDHQWLAGFDIGTLLWDEIDLRARALLSEVHSLAQTYGWTEPEILALSTQRRAAYLDLVVE
ncbi:MAG: hypothetical protein Q9M23_03340, partial [Mariprofundaceae bacterium]|nr:hypothetical protein [Mariprofundaceae bacterium]